MEFDSGAFGYFFDAVDRSAASEHGFRLELVMSVPWAWQIIDGDVSEYGWVIQLWDGRRVYLEYVVDEIGRRVPERLSVRPLTPRDAKPELDDPAVLWFEPRHVNDQLARPRRHASYSTTSPFIGGGGAVRAVFELSSKTRGRR